MADDDRDPTAEGEWTSESATPPSRRAAAQAASRARRIGGRPTPGGRARPGPLASQTDIADDADTEARTGAEPDTDTDTEADAGATSGTASSSTSRPATRTRVAGRRPTPGPRTEDDDAEADADAATATTTRRRAGARALQPPPAAATSTSSGTQWRRWIPAGVAAALVVALAIVDVLMLQHWRDQATRPERREQLVASVNGAVTKILSYDYRHLDQDEAAARSRLTGKFRDQYVNSMDTTVKKKAPAAKAVVVGEVGSAAVTSVTGDGKQAVLLVLGQQTVTNVKQPTPRDEIVSLRVTAQLVHGKWLVSDLATL